jgi:hypothetical protein
VDAEPLSEDVGERSPAWCGTREQGRRRAAVLLIITSVLWLHQWAPVIFVVGFVVWILLHGRLEGELGQRLAMLWRRGWPPATVVLVPLLAAGTLAYWAVDVPLSAKALPVAVNVLALSLLAFGSWWRLFAASVPDAVLSPRG